MSKNIFHVVPNPKGGWDVKKGDKKRALGSFRRKEDAVSYGRDMGRKVGRGGALIIHRSDGSVQKSHFYGGDAFPPMAKKGTTSTGPRRK